MGDYPNDKVRAFEEALARKADQRYVFKLYVIPGAANSLRAIENLKALCERHIPGRYELEVIDVRSRPKVAKEGQILAAPTLVKELPLPIRRFIGDLSNAGRIMVALDLT